MRYDVMVSYRMLVAFYFDHKIDLEKWISDKEFLKDDKRFLSETFINKLIEFSKTDSASAFMKASDAMSTLERRYWNKELGHN